MKKFFLAVAGCTFFLCLTAGLAGAKSYVSKSFEDKYQRMGDREARSMMRRMDIAEGEEFTLSDFKNLKLSRREEKEIRAARKEGTYKTPEEQFKEMDTDRNGKVNREELEAYYTRQAYREEPSRKDRSSNVAKYGEPLPELTPEQEALHDEMIVKAVASEKEVEAINENPSLTADEKKEKIKEVQEKYYPKPKAEDKDASAQKEENNADVAADKAAASGSGNAAEAGEIVQKESGVEPKGDVTETAL